MNYEKLDAIVASMKDEMVANLQRWLSIDTIKASPAGEGAPFGENTKKMLEMALEDARAFGFETRNFDGYAGDISMGSGAQTMGMLAHLDVVPVGEGWTHNPWGGEIADGKLYGRGAIDDKGPAMCALYAMRAVKEAGIPLKDGVRLILGCDEETGMQDMVYYAEHADMPDYGFSPDAEFPVINIEKGGLTLELSKYTGGEVNGELPVYELYAGERVNVVPSIAYAVLGVKNAAAFKEAVASVAAKNNFRLECADLGDGRMRLTANGVGAHASTPHLGVNAAGMLLIALKELGAGTSSKDAIAAIADMVGLEYTGAAIGIAQEDEISGPLTCNLGLLRYDGQNLTARLDCRTPLCADEKAMCGAVTAAMGPYGIAVTEISFHTPHHVSKEHKIVRGLLKVYGDVTGLDAYAFAIGGGTYSRMMPNTVAFGLNFPGDVDTCHMPDEYIDIEKMVLSTKIFAHAIAELAGGLIED